MFTNPLENVGSYMRENVAKFGEEMMGNMIESLLANQDTAVSQLQDLQKWNVVKLVQKLLTTRFFPREKPFVAIEESPALSALYRTLSPSSKADPISLGNLSLRVNGADSIFLVHWRNSKLELAKNVKWRVRVKYLDKVIDGPITVLQPPETIGAQRWLPRPAEDEVSSYPSLLRWNDFTFDLGQVYDLHTDIQIELLHRKLKETEKVRETPAPTKGVSELRSFFGKDPHPSSTKHIISPRAGAGVPGVPSSLTDLGDADGDSGDEAGVRQIARSNLSVNWTVYGRVVLPLSMWLVTSTLDETETQTARQTTCRSTMITPPRMETSVRPGEQSRRKIDVQSEALLLHPNLKSLPSVCRTEAWYHLYPPNQQESEYKFTKPCSGYPGLGMLNPLVSLGFINVSLEFERKHNPYIMSLISNYNVPSKSWIIATKFDLQVFESAGLRLHHFTAFTPRWMRRFCHLGSLYYRSRDDYDVTLVVVFWLIAFCTTVLSPLYLVPLGLACAVWCVSISYWRQPSDTSGTLYYIPPPIPASNLPHNPLATDAQLNALAQAFGARGPKTKGIFQGWMESAVLNLKTPRLASVTSPSPNLTRKLQSMQIATPYSQRSTTFLTSLGASPNTDMNDKESLDSTKTPTPPPPAVASLVMPMTDIAPSPMATVFGRACIAVRDTTSYAPAFPLFADDCCDVDLLLLKHLGLLVVELVQFLATIVATVVEKVKFAFDWTDPFISVVSLFLISVLALQMAILLKFLGALPTIVARLLFIFVPGTTMVLFTDPVICAVTGLATKIDKMAISIFKWQPESALICRLCQNIWDVFYLQNLLTDSEREERHRMMAQVFESLNEKNKQKDLLAAQQGASDVAGVGVNPSTLGGVNVVTNGGDTAITSTDKQSWFSVFTKRKDSMVQSITQAAVDEVRELNIGVDDIIERLRRRKPNNVTVVQAEVATSNRLGKKDSTQELHGAVGVRSTMTIVQEKPSDGLLEKTRYYCVRILYGLWRLLQPVASAVVFSAIDAIVQILKIEVSFILNWFLRLPDRREIEHRQIAATQYMGNDLSLFITPRADQGAETGTPRGGSRTPTQLTAAATGTGSPESSASYNKELIDFYRNANKTLSKARGHGGWTAALAPKGSTRHAAVTGTQAAQ